MPEFLINNRRSINIALFYDKQVTPLKQRTGRFRSTGHCIKTELRFLLFQKRIGWCFVISATIAII